MGHAMAARQELSDAEEAKKQAYELILGSSREVFDLSKEKPDPRGRYGRHQFGQDCLVARRLVEKGVPYIYQLGGIDASARLPHPMGLEAHVLPSISEGVKSAGLLTEIM